MNGRLNRYKTYSSEYEDAIHHLFELHPVLVIVILFLDSFAYFCYMFLDLLELLFLILVWAEGKL